MFCEFWNQRWKCHDVRRLYNQFSSWLLKLLFYKTDIDVMMLPKFDIKYVKLNFKAIASMEFSFDLIHNLLCSYDGSLFMKNH